MRGKANALMLKGIYIISEHSMGRDFSGQKERCRSEWPGSWAEVRKKVVKKGHVDSMQKQ